MLPKTIPQGLKPISHPATPFWEISVPAESSYLCTVLATFPNLWTSLQRGWS
jgi:hypothetical protein